MKKFYHHFLITAIIMALIVTMIPVGLNDPAYAGEMTGSRLKAAVKEIQIGTVSGGYKGGDLCLYWDRPENSKLLNGYKVYYSETKDGERKEIGFAYQDNCEFIDYNPTYKRGYFIIKGFAKDGDKTYYTNAKKINISKIKKNYGVDYAYSIKKSSAKNADFKVTKKSKNYVNKGVSIYNGSNGKKLLTMSLPFEKSSLQEFYTNGLTVDRLWVHGKYFAFQITNGYGEKINIVYDIFKNKAKKMIDFRSCQGSGYGGGLVYTMSFGYPGYTKFSFVGYDGRTITKTIAESDYAAAADLGRSSIVYAVVNDEQYYGDGYSDPMPFDIYEYNLLTKKRTYCSTIYAFEIREIRIEEQTFTVSYTPSLDSGIVSQTFENESYARGFYVHTENWQ